MTRPWSRFTRSWIRCREFVESKAYGGVAAVGCRESNPAEVQGSALLGQGFIFPGLQNEEPEIGDLRLCMLILRGGFRAVRIRGYRPLQWGFLLASEVCFFGIVVLFEHGPGTSITYNHRNKAVSDRSSSISISSSLSLSSSRRRRLGRFLPSLLLLMIMMLMLMFRWWVVFVR